MMDRHRSRQRLGQRQRQQQRRRRRKGLLSIPPPPPQGQQQGPAGGVQVRCGVPGVSLSAGAAELLAQVTAEEPAIAAALEAGKPVVVAVLQGDLDHYVRVGVLVRRGDVYYRVDE
jgi:hypothetical protein